MAHEIAEKVSFTRPLWLVLFTLTLPMPWTHASGCGPKGDLTGYDLFAKNGEELAFAAAVMAVLIGSAVASAFLKGNGRQVAYAVGSVVGFWSTISVFAATSLGLLGKRVPLLGGGLATLCMFVFTADSVARLMALRSMERRRSLTATARQKPPAPP